MDFLGISGLNNRFKSCALTLPENNSLKLAHENGWLEYDCFRFLFGMAYVQERTVSFSECIVWVLVAMNKDEKKHQESRH